MPATGLLYLIVDEVTYIRGWERAVKFCADAGMLEHAVLMVTGSDLSIVREARTLLPGRRGAAARVDFHLMPLDYRSACELKGLLNRRELEALTSPDPRLADELSDDSWTRAYRALDEYLVHGGFLTAINDMARDGRVLPATLAIYSDWIRGDMLKRGKQELYLREVLGAVVRRLGSQLTWNALARDLSIDHPSTVADYVELLAAMDALFVHWALVQDRLAAAPKKARKVLPSDPFILHAVRSWLRPVADPHQEQILPMCADPLTAGPLVEATVVGHARRHFPSFYIKAEGEVDLAVVDGGTFWPIEVKWRTQTRPKDLKQIRKYPNGVVAAPVRRRRTLDGTPVLPLPVVLGRLAVGIRP
jgi:predicted AAA+ superfamily ATPase